jgi:SOS-response transcriptional repressor LexA
MLRDVLERIEQRLAAVGLSATAASRVAGLSEDAIRNMRRAAKEDARQGVSTRTISALAPVLQTTAGWLMEGRGPEELGEEASVAIVGMVGANPDGSVLFSTGQAAGDRAPVPPGGSTGSAALEVRGSSMGDLAPEGSLIYFEDQRTPPTEDMLGDYVVAELDTGEVVVKRLLRGGGPGLYDLWSVTAPIRQGARVVWAAHITAIIPPRQARRIIRRAAA